MSSGAFITEVKVTSSSKDAANPLLDNVMKDYKKLRDVVQIFSKKIDMLIEKQRHEYTQAYEHHMIDVQKELHDLREKATAIANDTTRDEKLKKLDGDQKWFRAEAMRLDVETNEMRKRLRRVADKIQAAERERDWLLGKLRAVKDKYRKLKIVRSQLSNVFDGGLSISSESSYSLEMQTNKHSRLLSPMTTKDWKTKLTKEYAVSRSSHPKRSLPNAAPLLTPSVPKPAPREVALLVSERIKAKELTELLTQCRDTSIHGSWARNRRRPLGAILDDSWNLLQQQQSENDETHATIQQLAEELICYPDTFYALEALLFSHPSLMLGDGLTEIVTSADVTAFEESSQDDTFTAPADTVMSMRDSDLHLSDDVMRYLLAANNA